MKLDLSQITTTGAWRLEEAEPGIAVLLFDLPGEKVNKLTEAVLRDLDAVLAALAKEADLKALVVASGKADSDTFIAGADIQEIRAVEDPAVAREKAAQGQAVLNRFATMSAVTVAAVHGNCLGGGTELALACDLRAASHSPKTKIGLPEVLLGILPGFGGTQRLPRLVGLVPALPIVLSGQPVDVRKAHKIGLVDRVAYPPLLRAAAVALAKEALAAGGKGWRPKRRQRRPWTARLMEKLPWGRGFIRRRARKDVEKRVGHHYPAPFRALDAMVDGFALPIEKGLELEARLVGELAVSRVSKNCIDLFLSSERARRGERRAASDGGVRAEAPSCARTGARIGLLGAGVMGGGLAALLARKGFRVRMKDIHLAAVQAGLRRVHEVYGESLRRRRMNRREAAGYMAAITGGTDYTGFESAAVVIEAVVEDMAVKKKVLAEVEARMRPDAIFASNTSALSISEMQRAAQRPERVVGLHFFNPVERMQLVEVVRGEKTAPEVVEAAEALARQLGKLPVRVNDAPGFLVNRVLSPYLNEAVRLFEEGYSPAAIDREVRGFGMPMGPFELLDEVGLDVAGKVGHILHGAFGERLRPPELLGSLKGDPELLGKKSGRGFYIHRGKTKTPNPLLLKRGGTGGADFKPDDVDEWLRRLVYPMVNEAAMALGERVVERPSDVDLAMVMGTGFAPFRGGPLRYADSLGLGRVVEALESLKEPRLAPCEFLKGLAARGASFYSLEPSDGVAAGGSVHSPPEQAESLHAAKT